MLLGSWGEWFDDHAWEIWCVVSTVVNDAWWICCQSFSLHSKPTPAWRFSCLLCQRLRICKFYFSSRHTLGESSFLLFLFFQLELSWVTHCLWLFKRSFWLKFNFHHLLTCRESSLVVTGGEKTGAGGVPLQKHYLNIATLALLDWRRSYEGSYYTVASIGKVSFQEFFWRSNSSFPLVHHQINLGSLASLWCTGLANFHPNKWDTRIASVHRLTTVYLRWLPRAHVFFQYQGTQWNGKPDGIKDIGYRVRVTLLWLVILALQIQGTSGQVWDTPWCDSTLAHYQPSTLSVIHSSLLSTPWHKFSSA